MGHGGTDRERRVAGPRAGVGGVGRRWRGEAGDIAALDQHFSRPGNSIAPWMFVPAGNIKEFSTEEHPGLATIYEAGRGHDIKGLLEHPIRIGDYRLPWEFQTSLMQSFNLTAGVAPGLSSTRRSA